MLPNVVTQTEFPKQDPIKSFHFGVKLRHNVWFLMQEGLLPGGPIYSRSYFIIFDSPHVSFHHRFHFFHILLINLHRTLGACVRQGEEALSRVSGSIPSNPPPPPSPPSRPASAEAGLLIAAVRDVRNNQKQEPLATRVSLMGKSYKWVAAMSDIFLRRRFLNRSRERKRTLDAILAWLICCQRLLF